MSPEQQQVLTEAKFSEMVAGALAAHGIEGGLRDILQKASGQNGRPSLISLPGVQAMRLNVPSAQELGLVLVNAVLIALQTARITLVALNDLDTRLRLQQKGSGGMDGSWHAPAVAPEE